MSDTQAEFSRVSSEENPRANHLNLQKGRNGPTAFFTSQPQNRWISKQQQT